MGKKKTKSETLVNSTTEPTSTESTTESKTSSTIETADIPESMKEPEPSESPKPTPKFNGPTISFKNVDVKGGGVVSVTCIDNKVPLNKIQIIEIKTGDTRYVYRRI